MTNSNNNNFKFSYSAPTANERKEIESIRNSYLPKTQTEISLEALRRLDAKVKNTPTTLSLCAGIIGTLVFGLGLTMILEWNILVFGIIVCIIGLVPTLLAYPIFTHTSKKLKAKYSEQIVALSDELLNKDNEDGKV